MKPCDNPTCRTYHYYSCGTCPRSLDQDIAEANRMAAEFARRGVAGMANTTGTQIAQAITTSGSTTTCNPIPASAPESAEGEHPMSLIDEVQIQLLDEARSARDRAHRYFKSKNDKARLMEIQLAALRAEAAEGIKELNEDFPLPDDE